VTHIDLLEVLIVLHSDAEWFHLVFRENVLDEVEFGEREHLEEFSDGVSAEFVIVQINVLEVPPPFEDASQGFGSFVVYFIVGQVYLVESVALVD
jgi:uncharacterized membrane protein